ncbi:MAG: T9SS type A sorting domain-containing protein, partial [Dysgonamonadaceae bacterium]|nr:T9SS type A sorting domain-containing protein [Dysgonamonadaceae bacterium]
WKLFTATSPGEEFDSQKFIVQDAGDGYVRFINKHSDMILEIFDDGLSTEGAKVWQITDVRQDGALWRLIDTSLSIQAAGEEETGSRIIVYPNPVKESLNMDLPAEWTNSRFVIHNVSGRAVQSGLVTPHAIPVARLAPGYYILKVYKENGVRIASFIKQ